jgi:hypothetical protein
MARSNATGEGSANTYPGVIGQGGSLGGIPLATLLRKARPLTDDGAVHDAGRPPGRVMSKDAVISQGNAAMDRHGNGPVYKWWLARELNISVPTLRAYLHDYDLSWPPPWAPAA